MARVRIEYFSTVNGVSHSTPLGVVSEFSVTGTATSGSSRPATPSGSDLIARIFALDGPVYAASGVNPNATGGNTDVRIEAGGTPFELKVYPGELLSFITAAADTYGDGAGATAANQSTEIAALGLLHTDLGVVATTANQTLQLAQETAVNTVLGTQADATWDGSAAASGVSIFRYLGVKIEAVRALLAGTLAVSGTFWQTTQPVSGGVNIVDAAGANKAAVDASGHLQVDINDSLLALETGGNLAASAAVLGTTTGAAIDTDASGTIQQYLRGLVKQWVAGTLQIGAAENHIGAVGGHAQLVVSTVNCPSGTPTYASGQLIANSATAGSVAPMSFAISRATGKGGMIRRVRIRKSGTSLTNASVRLHLYKVSPTCSNGDNAAWLTDNATNYVGSLDVTFDKAFTDGASGNGVPNVGSEINFTSDTYYGLLEARAGYARAASETFTVELEVVPN